ncbi:uncharacterized protein LOC121764848 [Salvia splendens]|uniref:uncharacterized protein LOC121764848 n=1 Tax=Salvia splendens TaxID=180675 RepID=UPI001C271368|nr:uncharacterized protein LOC121764848 [Salvia splendens]
MSRWEYFSGTRPHLPPPLSCSNGLPQRRTTWLTASLTLAAAIVRISYEMGHYKLFKWCDLQIDILKRLQREAFSDIMKLRDRQDKVERLLTFYKSSKGSPFQESGTLVRGNVNVLGAFFVMDDVDEHAIQTSAFRNGIDARLRFETDVREKDKLVAEYSANANGKVICWAFHFRLQNFSMLHILVIGSLPLHSQQTETFLNMNFGYTATRSCICEGWSNPAPGHNDLFQLVTITVARHFVTYISLVAEKNMDSTCEPLML